MIYGFYFRFYKIFHNEFISGVLSKIAYSVYLLKFQIRRIRTKKQIIKLSVRDAEELIEKTYPDPNGNAVCRNASLKENIDLSIIVPVFNYADLIEKNIDSILAQKTHFNYELILVDDGSTDGAREVIQKYNVRDNVKIIFQQNMGIAGARNTGLNNASGKYIMFVDCDDIVSDNIVEILLSRAIRENADITMCGHNLVKEKNGVVQNVIPNIYPSHSLYGLKGRPEILDYAGLPWAKVYKRELFDKIRFFPQYWYEDSIIQFLVFTQCNRFIYIPVACYEYKWYEKNFSHTQDKSTNVKSLDRYWLLLRMLKQYDEISLPKDEMFYIMLLRHTSKYFYPQLAKLDQKVVEAAFVLACDVLKRNKPNHRVKMPYMLRVTEKAMLTGDINLWKLAIKYQ